MNQKEKAERFHDLHHNGKMLVLPNIWDPLGAMLLENLEYPAIATASASISYSNGLNDGENLSFSDLLIQLKKITNSVSVPVTADIENGYADSDHQLEENIRLLLDAGIVGINIEDTDHKLNELVPIEEHCHNIQLIKNTADKIGVPLFINARTDVYVHSKKFASAEIVYEEALKRGKAYHEAGADCFYPIILTKEEEIKNLVDQLDLPINILTNPGIPDLKTLSKMGVARVSLGPSFLKIAIRAMKELAIQLKDHEGLSSITGNEITSDYLKMLVRRKHIH
jgi:2-methylisocitrate lyase-like PEP mutase family enzyme